MTILWLFYGIYKDFIIPDKDFDGASYGVCIAPVLLIDAIIISIVMYFTK